MSGMRQGRRASARQLAAVVGAAVVAGLLSPPGHAQTANPPVAYLVPYPPPAPDKIIDELKVGALAHDIQFLGTHVESGVDVNIEMLFTSPDLLAVLGSPRPHLGADINTSGNTSDGYFGLTWGITLIQNLFNPGDGLFANGSLGGALQDGYQDTAPPGRKRLGSVVLFRESAELGYQVTPTISVSAILDHISNANLAPRNAGITSAGARIGFKF
jgi:lipid A 3-O-deacylase